MVHIRQIEIFGFKSFGFKNTTVEFEPGLVSISGPNGSGKSNILDAIIFALGENRPKIMHADKLRSLIHDKGAARCDPKISRVSVHFDNSDRKIPVDSNRVVITREMDDKGENIYYLNQKKDNRSHILDILEVANAGLNQLNAVQHDTVEKVTKFTSEELRKTIENLIGLSFFDEKKTTVLRQLERIECRLESLTKTDKIKTSIEQLKEEQNSIIKRFEEIENDKRQTFLDAFDKIDKEIRYTFSKITGGSAWLQLENEDDIFSSGLYYFIQLPNKQKNEFTLIRGSEKLLAAIIFVLALQKLKLSPFYLLDQIDNHLDGPNSERFAKIIEERSQNSQVIMVTGKDPTVQRAKLVYGVFPQNGSSHVVAYQDKN